MSAQPDILRNNLHAQLDRLIEQLADLDQIKSEMDEDEYKEERQNTVDQLEDFSKSLEKMKSGEGGPSLLDDVQRIQNVRARRRDSREDASCRCSSRLSNVPSVKHFKLRKSFDSSRRNNRFSYAIDWLR